MKAEVRFPLDPEGGEEKSFLSGAFLERETEDVVAFGVAHRDGSSYAFSRVSKMQFMSAVRMLFPEEFK